MPSSTAEARARASRHNERGRELADAGRSAEAVAEYERACALDPSWSAPPYNLGLLYKYAGDWEASARWNRRAAQLDASDPPTWWNLAIAATALGRWDEARRAWRAAGVAVADGEGPVEHPCGLAPVRLDPEGEGEVVWCQRLDPARARIQNIPLPRSGFRWRDVVLNDGAANGYRSLDGRDVPVFDCLGLLQASRYSTCLAEVEASAAEIEALAALAEQRDLATEDWTTSLRFVCRACSEGRPHAEHDRDAQPIPGAHRVAIAAPALDMASRLLDDWRSQAPAARVLRVSVVLEADHALH
jgi:hypothetical protein